MPARKIQRTSKSPSPSATSAAGFQPTQRALAHLQSLLPSGFLNYFTPTPAGAHVGLEIKCGICERRPPDELNSYQRWRWLAIHTTTVHRGLRLMK